MEQHYLDSAWEVIKAIMVTLGGLAGVTKILEWLFSGPKIIGRVEQTMSADEKKPDGSHVGAACFYLIYVVNKHVDPTTIQGFEISAKVGDKWVVGRVCHIAEGLDLPLPDGVPKINFSENRLYEKVGQIYWSTEKVFVDGCRCNSWGCKGTMCWNQS